MKPLYKIPLYTTMALLLFCSCQDNMKNHVVQLMKEWEGKEVLFPSNSVFTIQGKDTIKFSTNNNTYKIVTYVDSVGCTSCKLQLPRWQDFIHEMKSLNHGDIPFFFYFYPKDKSELKFILHRENFDYPVCLDENDNFNKLNHFPMDIAYQTFLLDKDNRVLAMGNPIHNSKIKKLYLDIIEGKQVKCDTGENIVLTKADIERTSISLGHFAWQDKQQASFALKNTGQNLLVIQEVTTSCGCIEVSYPKAPVSPGDSILLDVTYKADHPGYFHKTITVHCNAEASPLALKITGNAEER